MCVPEWLFDGVTFRNTKSFWVFKTTMWEVASIHQYLGNIIITRKSICHSFLDMYNSRCFVHNFGDDAWRRCLATMLGCDAWLRCLAAMLGDDAWRQCFNNTINTVSSIIIRIIIVVSVIIIFVGSLWNGCDNRWKVFEVFFLEDLFFRGCRLRRHI